MLTVVTAAWWNGVAVAKTKKSTPVKYAKRTSAEREAQHRLQEYVEAMAQRGAWARKIFDAQDARTQEAMRRLMDILSDMSDQSGYAKITTSSGWIISLPVDQSVYENGWRWIAVRLMNAAYEWDIQVANFHPIAKRKPRAKPRKKVKNG
jgi:hypothetical protein